MRFRFLKPVLIVTLILAALLAYPVYAWFPDTRSEIYAAGIIALVNALIGIVIVELTLNKDNTTFMASFFGGMGLRIFLTLFVFAYLLMEDYDGKTLTFFLMGFYIIYMVMELRYVVKEMTKVKAYQKRRQ